MSSISAPAPCPMMHDRDALRRPPSVDEVPKTEAARIAVDRFVRPAAAAAVRERPVPTP